MTEIKIGGLLYILNLRAIKKDSGERIRAAYLLSGDSADDVKRKLAYIVDLSDYSEFSIQSVTKIREKAHLLWMSIKDAPMAPDFVEGRSDGSVSHFSHASDATDLRPFAIGVACKVFAASEAHALHRLGRHLSSHDSPGYRNSPLSADSLIHVEELGEVSDVALPRSQEIFMEASFVRG